MWWWRVKYKGTQTERALTLDNISVHILHTDLYISQGADEESLFSKREPLKLVIISSITLNVMYDSGVKL